MNPILADLAASMALCALRQEYAPQGWRIFISDKGRWWATTTRRPVTGRTGRITVNGFGVDAVDANDPYRLAAKLEGR